MQFNGVGGHDRFPCLDVVEDDPPVVRRTNHPNFDIQVRFFAPPFLLAFDARHRGTDQVAFRKLLAAFARLSMHEKSPGSTEETGAFFVGIRRIPAARSDVEQEVGCKITLLCGFS
jgi:hypothetical protein